MSQFVGEKFEDYGDAPECVIDSIPSYEVLPSGLVRIFVCKTIKGRVVLDHTDIMTRGMLVAIGKRLIEIADEATTLVPDIIPEGENRKVH